MNPRDYITFIGRPRHDLITPALILDLDIARDNIANMAAYMRGVPAKLRPHIKVHKSPELGRMQIEAGESVGLTTATVWEAVVMVRGGINDILVANEVVGEEKIRTLAELAREAHVIAAIDDAQNAEDLSSAALKAGSALGVLIDLDVGMERCGVRTKEEALRLAQHVSGLRGLRFELPLVPLNIEDIPQLVRRQLQNLQVSIGVRPLHCALLTITNCLFRFGLTRIV